MPDSDSNSHSRGKKDRKASPAKPPPVYFEVEVVRDRNAYLPPHLNLEAAWALDVRKKRARRLPAMVTG